MSTKTSCRPGFYIQGGVRIHLCSLATLALCFGKTRPGKHQRGRANIILCEKSGLHLVNIKTCLLKMQEELQDNDSGWKVKAFLI